MFIKNLLRRKTRTLLTMVGIAVGVAAIIAMGALANGLEAGYGSMLKGSKADLIISQPDSFDITYSAVDEADRRSNRRRPGGGRGQPDGAGFYPGRRRAVLLRLWLPAGQLRPGSLRYHRRDRISMHARPRALTAARRCSARLPPR